MSDVYQPIHSSNVYGMDLPSRPLEEGKAYHEVNKLGDSFCFVEAFQTRHLLRGLEGRLENHIEAHFLKESSYRQSGQKRVAAG